MAGVAEMVARTVIALVLIPVLGYFGAELSNPGSLGGGLPVPVPGLPVDGQTPGKPPACRPPCHAAQRGRGLTP